MPIKRYKYVSQWISYHWQSFPLFGEKTKISILKFKVKSLQTRVQISPSKFLRKITFKKKY